MVRIGWWCRAGTGPEVKTLEQPVGRRGQVFRRKTDGHVQQRTSRRSNSNNSLNPLGSRQNADSLGRPALMLH